MILVDIFVKRVTFLVTGFLVFINLFSVKYGAIALQEVFDSIQPKQVILLLFIKYHWSIVILSQRSCVFFKAVLMINRCCDYSASSEHLFCLSSGCLAWSWRRSWFQRCRRSRDRWRRRSVLWALLRSLQSVRQWWTQNTPNSGKIDHTGCWSCMITSMLFILGYEENFFMAKLYFIWRLKTISLWLNLIYVCKRIMWDYIPNCFSVLYW